MINNETIKLKFDNSFNGRLFAVQGDTGRVFNLQIFDDFNNPVDITGMNLRMYVANSKEVSYSDGEIVEAGSGKIKVQVYNSQLKYPGKQKAQFILTDKDGQKIGSKIFDLWVEEGLENGPTVGRNIYVDFDKINETLGLIKDYDKTLEEAKEVDMSLKVGITEGTEIKNNLAECKKKALEIKGQLDESKVNANEILENLRTTKTESEILKSNLNSENQKATENIRDLSVKIETGKNTTSELNEVIEDAKSNKNNLDSSNANALNTKKSLEDVINAANTTKIELDNLKNQGDTLSDDLSSKITTGGNVNSNLDRSVSDATTAKSNLDESIGNAASTNTNLKATDAEAKNTENLIRGLMSQLNLTKDEVQGIIASGNLDQYVTDPKLEKDLEPYARKTDVPKNLSQLTEDSTHRTVTDNEKENWNNKLDQSAVTSDIRATGTDKVFSVDFVLDQFGRLGNELNNKVNKIEDKSLSTNDFTNEHKAKVDAIPQNPKYTDTTYDLSGYAKKTDIPKNLSQLVQDSNNRTVTDNEKAIWNNKVDKIEGKTLYTNDYSNADKAKVNAIPSSAKYTDTITTINGKTGAITKADIVALGIPSQDTNTTYGLVSQSSNGLMSSADKKRLDNIKEQVILTESQYSALSSTQQNDTTKIYFIKA